LKRVAIIGSGGSGKSTLARKLGEILQINVYHLDALFWRSGWVGTSKEEQRSVQENLVGQEKWIMDGNYGGTIDIRLNHADTIIFLDIPRITCLIRVIKRRIQYRKSPRPDMGEGCNERLDAEFVKWVWNYPKVKKPAIVEKLALLSNRKEVIILSSTRAVNDFLQHVKMREGVLIGD
jgi:adenylate kinase family enzyme